jgi:dihydrolipoamide dehydrogenase
MSEKSAKTKLAVVGAGPGGYAAAFLAADLGVEVTLIDDAPNPGGVCLYRGCIPSKALLHAAKVIQDARVAADFGIKFGPPRTDLKKLRAWKDGVVTKLTGGVGLLAKQRKVRYVQGRASLLDAGTLRIEVKGGSETLSFEHLILAAGSRPAMLPGLPSKSARILDSTSALALPRVPKSLLVIGGGYIGLELGSVYAALGSRVTVVEMMPALLPGVDPDLAAPLAKRLEKEFASIRLKTRVAAIKEASNGLRVEFEGEGAGGKAEHFEMALVAVGRRPNSDFPGLDKTKVELDGRGFLRTDAQRRTAEASIFAIGDLAGEPMLAHKASHEGRVAAEVVAGHNKVVFDARAIPAVVFTDPEIAWCGLTETAAKQQGREVTVARFPWAASGRALTLGRSDGFTKLLLDPKTERVLGVGIVGPGAGELIAEGVLAVEMAATARDLALSIHPHPTLSETLMESAEVFFGTATHVYRPKKQG